MFLWEITFPFSLGSLTITTISFFFPFSEWHRQAVSAPAARSGPKLRLFRLQCAAAAGWAPREDPQRDPQGAEDQGGCRESAQGHYRQEECPAGGLTAPQLQAEAWVTPGSAPRAGCSHCGQRPWRKQRYSALLYLIWSIHHMLPVLLEAFLCFLLLDNTEMLIRHAGALS